MKVVHISTFAFTGGAARAAYRLHDGLKRAGVDSSMIVSPIERAGSAVVRLAVNKSFRRMLQRYIRGSRIQHSLNRYKRKRPEGLELFSTDRSRYGTELAKALPPCDVIHLHWVSGFVDLRGFFRTICANKTVIWTLHDMNIFSGGCHYDLCCNRYRYGCGRCPQLGSNIRNDLSRKIWNRKQRIFSTINPKNLHIITPSNWLADEAKQSPLLNRFSVRVIPYGIDTDEFYPRNKESARAMLGISPNTNVILFLAHNIQIERKGLKLLHGALQRIPNKRKYCLLSIGRGNAFNELKFQHIHIGRIENDRLLAAVISAAGLFVIPSQQDNLPNTVLEAMACGTPVLGFDTGGIPDMVREGRSGRLVNDGDVKGLSDQIVHMFEDQELLSKMSINSRRIAVEEYALNIPAQRYLDLYKQVCKGNLMNSA